jgi:Rrf2 family nitric oxide-sensitive transcriptional repressor
VRLATFTDHSLRVLVSVAVAPGGRTTIAELARELALGENHVVKVVHALGRLGLLANARGRGGGVRLAEPAANIGLARVVSATESWELAECFEGGQDSCPMAGKCRLEGVLHEALAAFREVLGRYTLEDLARSHPAATAVVPLAAVGLPKARS